MSTKIKLTIAVVQSPRFAPAFSSLLSDPSVATRDKYALARTMRDIQSHNETFMDQRLGLIRQHGEAEAAVLRRMAERGSPKAAQMVERADMLDKSPVSSWSVDPEDKDADAKVKEGIAELLKVEFEVFLDHKVVLGKDCKLTALEIEALLDIVDIEEPAPAK